MQHQSYNTLSIPRIPLRDRIISGGVLAVLVVINLYFFQPFGIAGFSSLVKLKLVMAFGLVAFLVNCGYFYFLYRSFSLFRTSPQWSLFTEGLIMLLAIELMALACELSHRSISGESFSWSLFYLIQRATFLSALIPIGISYYRIWNVNKQEQLLLHLKTQETEDKESSITISNLNKREKDLILNPSDLYYLESEGNYITVYHSSLCNDKLTKTILRNTLNRLEKQLPLSDFKRVHRSYIVRIDKIQSVELIGSNYSILCNGVDKKIPISRNEVKWVRSIV